MNLVSGNILLAVSFPFEMSGRNFSARWGSTPDAYTDPNRSRITICSGQIWPFVGIRDRIVGIGDPVVRIPRQHIFTLCLHQSADGIICLWCRCSSRFIYDACYTLGLNAKAPDDKPPLIVRCWWSCRDNQNADNQRGLKPPINGCGQSSWRQSAKLVDV
jgi:hypothetical protein